MSAADWKPYDVPGLAGLLAEQPTDSGTHAMAWQQAYETLTDQRQRLEAARAALTQAWPATPGGAAGSFFAEVDAVTQAMGATAESAVNAHGALTGIVTAVDGATAKVDALHQSWKQNQATIGDVVPTDDWTQPLNDQAHTVMGQADAAIAEHTTQLAPPVPYAPQPSHQTSTPLPLTHSSTGGHVSSSTRPGAASSLTSGSPLLSAVGGSSDIGSVSAQSVQTSPQVAGSTVAHRQVGATTLTAAGSGARNPTSGLTTGSESGVSSDQSNGSRDGRQGQVGGLQPTNDLSPAIGDVSALPRASDRLNPKGHAIPRRGSAGNTPISGRPDDSVRPNAQKPDLTVHSDGNAVRSGQEGSPSSLFRGSTTSTDALPIGGMMGGASTTSTGSSRSGRRDTHVDWPMPVGVSSILEPVAEAPILHDPGPGVIGIDR